MILLVDTNPAVEAPVLNARIRKAWLRGAEVALVGDAVDLTYDYFHAGNDGAALQKVVDMGGSDEIKAKASMVIVGQGALHGAAGAGVMKAAQTIATNTESGLLILHTAASRVGALDIGCTAEGGFEAARQAEVIFNLGVDETDMPDGAFVVYQGSHGDRGAHRADVILPGAAYTEEAGIFVNTEGRPQMAMRAGFAPGEAKENWAILRALSAELGQTLPFDSLMELRAALFEAVPHLAEADHVPENETIAVDGPALDGTPIAYAISEHFLTNPIARASRVMGELAQMAAERRGAKQLAAE